MNLRHLLRSFSFAFSYAALLVLTAGSQAVAEGTFDIPKGAHFNKQKLEKIGEFFRNEIATEKIPGAILLIQQHGKPVYHEFFGVRDVETKAPMTDDTIFRIFSMTKPITSVAAGGGGMLTTMSDFAKFSQMILDGGKFEGKQIISPKSFELMTSDHVGPGSGVQRDYFYFPGDGFGFGLGFGVRTDPGNAKPPPPGSLGELKWDSASGCYFVVDRKQDMFFVLLEQTPTERQRIQKAVKQLIYEAMEN
jgi:CubicO group peptidase (beta-lactamase class C family)